MPQNNVNQTEANQMSTHTNDREDFKVLSTSKKERLLYSNKLNKNLAKSRNKSLFLKGAIIEFGKRFYK